MTHTADEPERPRVEPEIIPPDRSSQSDWRYSPWRASAFGGARPTQRVYVTRIGPFGVALLALAIAAIVAIVVIAVLSAVLIWIPIVAAAVVLGAVLRVFRGFGTR